MRRLVLLESPYAGDIEANTAYARACLRDSLLRGESPMASHPLYTQALDDSAAEERSAGMRAGWAWLEVVDAVVVYMDLGESEGMTLGIARAHRLDVLIERRHLGDWT